MSEKRNDINNLAQKSRVLAALRGAGRPLTPVAAKPETSEMPTDGGEAVADEASWLDEADDEADEAIADEASTADAAVADEATDVGDALASVALVARIRPLATSARALAPIAPVSLRARPEELLGVFLASRGTLKSRRTTLQGLERCARAIGSPVEGVAWHELRVEHTTAIRGALIAAKYGKATITATLTALRGVLRYAYKLGFIPLEDYQRAVELDPIPGEAPLAGRALAHEEIVKLRAYCASETGAYGRFLDASFALLLGVGLRVTEACMMPVAGYIPARNVVRVRRKKNKEVELPVSSRCAIALDAWVEARRSFQKRISTQAFLVRVQRNDWVRPATAQMNDRTLEYVLACAARDAGVAHLTPHDLRRTFITTLLAAGKDTLTVAGLASHDDPKTTARYDRRGDEARAQAREEVEIW